MNKINIEKIPKELSDKYKIIRNSFVGEEVGKDGNTFKTIIGDDKQDDFFPQLKIERWSDNECNFSVRLIDDDKDKPRIKTEGNKIKFIKKDKECHFYNCKLEDGKTDAYEFEVLLKKKPKINKVKMSIETKGLKFFYQPELTEEEKKNSHRPENVVGSYAVYHESKQNDYHLIGGKNYMAGKAFHIYRPEIIDSTGKKVWGKLNIDVEKKLLSVEIPQEFLDNAVYPIKQAAGLLFGEDGLGATSTTTSNIKGSLFTGAAGLAQSISFNRYCAATVHHKAALYDGDSDNLHAQTEEREIDNGGWDWQTFDFVSPPSISATPYVIVGFSEYDTNFRFDSGSANQGHYQTLEYTAFPATASFTHTTNKFSIYCTYTPSGGAGDLKSLNGVAFADIKSVNSVAIADIKSINGISTT